MKKFPFDFKSILNKEDLFTALVVGLALRFAMTLSAGLPELIKNIQLDINSENLTVECKGQAKILLVDHVHGRLKFLSDLLDRKLVIKSWIEKKNITDPLVLQDILFLRMINQLIQEKYYWFMK